MNPLAEKLKALFKGDTPGYRFSVRMIGVLHFWDDLIDKDKSHPDEVVHEVMRIALLELPFDPFYQKFGAKLAPVLDNAILNWRIANTLEDEGSSQCLEVAFGLRSSYVDLISMSLAIENGLEYAVSVGRLLRVEMAPESFADYLSNLSKEKAACALVTSSAAQTFQIPTQQPALRELKTETLPSGTQP